MRQLLQPIAAFVYCNHQAAAGRRLRNWTRSELRAWAEFS